MQINTYLNFNGNCAEAFKFYEKVFHGKMGETFTHKDTPMAAQMPPDWLDKVMHTSLDIAGQRLMGSDAPPAHFQTAQGFSVSIGVNEIAEAERIYKELSEGGTIRMPLQQTFWAARFGMFIDRFGTPWMVNCEPDHK